MHRSAFVNACLMIIDTNDGGGRGGQPLAWLLCAVRTAVTQVGRMESPVTRRWGADRVHLLCLHPGSLTVGLLRQCHTIHGRERNCTPPQLPPEWITTLLFIVLGIVSLTITCGLMVMSRWRCEASRYARWIAFLGSTCSRSCLHTQRTHPSFANLLNVEMGTESEKRLRSPTRLNKAA